MWNKAIMYYMKCYSRIWQTEEIREVTQGCLFHSRGLKRGPL